MSDRPEDAEDWPLRDWSARIRPPAGTEPDAGGSAAEILYEDAPETEEEAPPEDEVAPGLDEQEPEDEVAPAVEEEAPAEDEDAPAVEEAPPEDEVAPAVEDAPAVEEEEEEATPEDEVAPEVEEEPEAEPEVALPGEHAEGGLGIPDGYAVLEGNPTGRRRSVAIVVSRFNGEITQRLLDSALAALDEAGVAQEAVLVMPVPGAFELPIAAMALGKTRRYSCVIALGCVIRGETPHFDFVASEAASGLQLAGIETGVPVSFGLLTCETVEQAEARVDKGAEAARTALEMADAFAQLRTTLAAAREQ
jgi:6,7-dimethyl-8-ribityllumazine synthase